MRVSAIVVALIFTGMFAPKAAGQTSAPAARADVEFFEKKIRPLLAEHCYRCHAASAKRIRGGLRLDNRADLLRGGDNGPAVVPGEPDKSLLIKAVHYGDANLQMPPAGKLSDRETQLLVEWVRRGAPFPGSPEAVRTQARSIDWTKARQFWSFQPLRPVELPQVKQTDWPRKRSDAFILAELEKRHLSPTAAADRRTLIRRAYFDLLGLPPTPEEVAAFVQDNSPDAYARLIDRLLASPHYGERWGRYWLDLARYCDVPESWSECKGPAYLYRDWVIRAINEDLPYDRFVLLQLAADAVPDAVPEDRAALGFLGLSPSYWKELKLAQDVIATIVAEEWEERIHTVSSTFLGLTVACARCHDHKFDPITTEDYYALAGVFASTKLTDRPLLPDAVAAEVRQARQQVKQLQARLTALQKNQTPQAQQQAKEIQQQMQRIQQQTPHWNMVEAPAVTDAALFVEPNGKYRTKLVYKLGESQDVAVHIRGNPSKLGREVPRHFLTVLSPDEPPPFTHGSGRLDLARAIVNEGQPLAARVMVNRVWKHHFGRGLVETPSDFGTQGERPSHPHLLDDLARRFVEHGWSLRWLHREIMLSAAYQQASTSEARKQEIDSDNRYLWRMQRRRLDVEAWRDAMLAVSGTLNRSVGGPAQELSDPKNNRRTLYGTVKRRELNDLLRLHDFPDPTTHSASRVQTITPLQQLYTLNSPFLQAQAAALVQRLKREAPDSTEARIQRAYQLLYGRNASAEQLRLGLDFLAAENAADTLWEQYVQALLGSNEFLFVD